MIIGHHDCGCSKIQSIASSQGRWQTHHAEVAAIVLSSLRDAGKGIANVLVF
jgi:carbonic anhydrase